MSLPPLLSAAGRIEVPAVGLGLWKLPLAHAADRVEHAIDVGYRHLDSACDYGNETAVGEGIRRSIAAGKVKRDDLWITSKLWNTYHAREHVRPACERTLRDLGVDYLDLYLIHFPIALRYVPFEERYPPEWLFDPQAEKPRMEFARVSISETWHAMEDLVRAGLVRNIGICNFNTSLLRDLLNVATIRPAMLQVEMHPSLTQEKLLRFCREEGIGVTAFSPFGPASYVSIGMAKPEDSLFTRPAVQAAAKRTGRSPAQVLLRWGVQRGTAVVPMTSRPERLLENLSVGDFELTAEEMSAIGALNENRRFNDPGEFAEAAFNTFCPIYD
ncbi:putative oxidoreductase YtbE [Caulifigura coniformis]|uniref:Putative oxidoreductase YtbE n=1 Tax=Caulifigura coniformis TaxID=2527983 RepID=A0A517S9W8_9PLAN|nr:aldo/keto reductase [Caulifigura coniformis]QDT52913.1 putative oxidoreductase YtbE [Caulifigura coniformis]